LPASVGSSVSVRLSSVTECPPPALLGPPPGAVEKPREILNLRLVDKGVILEVNELERVRGESEVVRKVVGELGGELTVEGMVEVEAFREAVDMMLEDEDEAAAMRRLARGGVARAIDVLEVSSPLLYYAATACLLICAQILLFVCLLTTKLSENVYWFYAN
jgi:hypothetical protein